MSLHQSCSGPELCSPKTNVPSASVGSSQRPLLFSLGSTGADLCLSSLDSSMPLSLFTPSKRVVFIYSFYKRFQGLQRAASGDRQKGLSIPGM